MTEQYRLDFILGAITVALLAALTLLYVLVGTSPPFLQEAFTVSLGYTLRGLGVTTVVRANNNRRSNHD